MFGRNFLEQAGQIAAGHFNEITNAENELFAKRIVICKECPLYSETSLGPVCSTKLCWNVSKQQKEDGPGRGIICGCGCRLNAKARLKNAKCVLNKWPKEK